MTVQPEAINELERKVHEEEDEASQMITSICEKQPYLHEWLVAKFNLAISNRALLGITLSAIALMQEDNEQAQNELIRTINILSNQSDLSCIVNSFNDTLTDVEVLNQLQVWNSTNS